MSKTKSAYKALGMTMWFVKQSWSYITTKHFSSKVEYFTGLIPSWGRFMAATYRDCRNA